MTAPTEDARARELLWADVGERLNLSVKEMRSIRTAFADVLGFGMSKAVSESLLPAIEFVARRRKEGAVDDEIRQELRSAKSAGSWPEEVLSRMKQTETQTAATASAACPPALTEPETGRLPEEGRFPEVWPPITGFRLIEPSVWARTETNLEAQTQIAETEAAETETAETEDAEKALRQVISDLRRELYTHLAAEREDVLRLEQCIRKLAIEVRDMRYALMLGFTRRDRKKGHKGVSSLLLG